MNISHTMNINLFHDGVQHYLTHILVKNINMALGTSH